MARTRTTPSSRNRPGTLESDRRSRTPRQPHRRQARIPGDIGALAVKTGMLASAAIISAVAETLSRPGAVPLVVDPVAASKHGHSLLRDDALDALRDRLLPLTTLLTPNLAEVRLLTGLDVRDRAGQLVAARRLHALGPAWVLVKGGHLPDGDAVDLLYDGHDAVEITAARADTIHVHGTGDTLAAAITAGLARGLPITPDTTRAVSTTGYPVLWAITWRTRSASWMLRNRPLLEHALA